MALKGSQIDLILGLKLSEFFNANKKAWVEYSKTKGKIEKDPVRFRETGSKSLLATMAKMGALYLVITRAIPDMIRVSNEQEKADTRLAQALKNVNEYSEENFRLFKQQASAIQNITIVGDEQSEMLQTLALNMGINTKRLDEATRGAIGLSSAFSSAGLSQETAMKGVALAYQGNFEQLQRYIPALRTTKDVTEKMAILQKAMADGFKMATEEAKSGAGQMQQFSNLVGDFKEEIGDLIKSALMPMIQTGKPIVQWLNDMDEGTRNTTLAMSGFILITPKLITALRGLSIAIGPAGWLTLALGVIITLWLENESAAERAATAIRNYKKAADELNTDQIEKEIKELNDEIERTKKLITEELEEGPSIFDVILAGARSVIGGFSAVELPVERYIDQLGELNNKEKAYNEILKERNEIKAGAKPVIPEIPGTPGARAPAEILTPDIEPLKAIHKDMLGEEQQFRFKMLDISTQFDELGMTGLNDEYARKTMLLDDQLDQVREHLGEESQLYQDLALKKLVTEKNYQKQKNKLAELAIKEAAALGDEVMQTFQAQSSILFGIGKALAMANLAITKGEAIARAYKDYPWPFNLIVMGIQAALVAQQIANVSKVNFKPTGKKEGGVLTSRDIIGRSFLPPEEDGYFAGQLGEMVMNRYATRKYFPVLNQMNREKRRGFAEGGIIQNGDLSTPIASEDLTLLSAVVENAIISGFSKSSIKVKGEFRQSGRDMRAVLDKIEELKEQA